MSPQGGPSGAHVQLDLAAAHPRKCPWTAGGEQTRQSQLLCFVSERVPGPVSPSSTGLQAPQEEAAAGRWLSRVPDDCRARGKPWVGVRLPVGLRLLQRHQEPPAAGRHRGHWPSRLVGSLCDPSQLAPADATFLTRLPDSELSSLHRLLEIGGAAAEALSLPRKVRLAAGMRQGAVGWAGNLVPYRGPGCSPLAHGH